MGGLAFRVIESMAMKTEAEMLKYRNFGKKSFNDKLSELGLSLGMTFDPALLVIKEGLFRVYSAIPAPKPLCDLALREPL